MAHPLDGVAASLAEGFRGYMPVSESELQLPVCPSSLLGSWAEAPLTVKVLAVVVVQN